MVAGYDGFVRAVNADGTLAWKHDLVSDAPEAPPGFDQQKAVITGNAARPRTMASDGSTLFVPIFDQSRVVAVDASTGKRRWSYQTKGWMYAEPTVSGDDVFVTSQDSRSTASTRRRGRSAGPSRPSGGSSRASPSATARPTSAPATASSIAST